MKDRSKNNFQFIIWVLFPVLFFSCNSDKKESQGEVYYCPMDSGVVQHEPGTCPKCKMELVKKENKLDTIYYCPMCPGQEQNKPGMCKLCIMDLEVKPHSHDSMIQKDWVLNPVNNSVLSNVKAIKPILKSVPVTIKVSGYVDYDTRRIYNVSSRVAGRIEKLYVKYTFQPVKKGQALFEIYSHELLSAQHDYLFLRKNDSDAIDLINASKKKLLLLGMSEKQVEDIKSGDHVHPASTIYSPYTGYVLEKNPNEEISLDQNSMASMSNSESGKMTENNKSISLREGAYLGKGETAFKIVNTDIVWGIFEVYSDQLPLIKKNQIIHIMLENTDEMIMGKIDFIEPTYKGGSGTVKFRVYLNNKDQNLKIGNILSGEVETGMKKGLWIPQTAMYDLGRDKIVFVKRDGAFETRKIIIGMNSGNEIEIISGLSEGEEIAENAQFLIDSESFVKVSKE